MNFKTRFAVNRLKQNGVIALPTDTIYGLSCLPNKAAINKLLKIKQRDNNKGLILLANDTKYFYDFVEDVTVLKNIKISKNPTTYLLKARKNTGKLLTGGFDTIALRLTDDKLIGNICDGAYSAIVSTSANISGKKNIANILQLKLSFKDKLDYIIAPKNNSNKPSLIINLTTKKQLR